MSYISIFGEEHPSIEAYIQESLRNNAADIAFKNLEDFRVLYKKGFLKPGMFIRTSDKGEIDEHYRITDKGNLEGIADLDNPYPGKKGIFKPEEILKSKRISDGWSITGEGKFRFNFIISAKNGPGGI